MSKAPKKIWVGGTEESHGDWGTIDVHPDDIPYIRADIVDELVEALKGVVRYAGNNGDDYLADKARAALAKLEESHE